MNDVTHLACACGALRVEAEREPILCAECHCASCRAAASKLEALPGAPRITSTHGGTPFVLYRKDRVRFLQGAENLKELRLTPESPTRRVVATCCNTPVFLEFQSGHWLSVYTCLWPDGAAPRMQMRTMTSDRTDTSPLPDDLPNAKTQSFAFMRKLLGAWIAMGFRVPKIATNGALVL